MSISETDPDELYRRLLARINQPGIFSTVNHMQVTKISHQYAEGELTVAPDSLNPRGLVHGGAIGTLMDSVAGIAAATSGRDRVTVNCSLQYLRPAKDTLKLRCVAAPIKQGRTLAVYSTTVTDDAGREIARGTHTYYLLEEF